MYVAAPDVQGSSRQATVGSKRAPPFPYFCPLPCITASTTQGHPLVSTCSTIQTCSRPRTCISAGLAEGDQRRHAPMQQPWAHTPPTSRNLAPFDHGAERRKQAISVVSAKQFTAALCCSHSWPFLERDFWTAAPGRDRNSKPLLLLHPLQLPRVATPLKGLELWGVFDKLGQK